MRKYDMSVKTAFAVFAIVLSACSSDNDVVEEEVKNPETPVISKTMTFSASMDDENTTRTTFSDDGTTTNTVWATGDAIEVLNAVSEEQSSFGIYNGVGTKSAKFQGTSITANMDGTDQFYAFYPATTLTYADGVVTASGKVSIVQSAEDETYDQSLHFMSAYSTSSTFNFKNVCALLKITLENNTSTISRVKVVANPTLTAMDAQKFTYTYIAGDFTATILDKDDDGDDDDEIGTATTTVTTTATTSQETGETVEPEYSTYVELRAANDVGVKLSEESNELIYGRTPIGSGTFYMVVLPATLKNGFTIIMEDVSGNVYQRISKGNIKFERNKLYDLGTYNCSSASTLSAKMTSLGKDVVDLDLPSGTIWCTKNLVTQGGSFTDSEYEYGGYFSYGDTYVHYFPFATSSSKMTDKTLKGQYDVAYTMNPMYCTPIYAQLFEFYNSFSNKYKDSFKGSGNTNKGAKFWTAAGRYIWLPYAGHWWGGQLQDEGSAASYWSRTNAGRVGTSLLSDDAYCIDMKEGNVTVDGVSMAVPILDSHSGILDGAAEWHDNTYSGRSIRPVVTNNQIAPIK